MIADSDSGQQQKDEKFTQSTPQQVRDELDEAAADEQAELVTVVTPLLVNANRLTVYRGKIHIVSVQTGDSSGPVDIPIEEVDNVTAHGGMFSSYIKIEQQFLKRDQPLEIGPFRQKEAQIAAAIAQGYVVALKRGINLDALPGSELRDKLLQVGGGA
jgi:hypothetical protein